MCRINRHYKVIDIQNAIFLTAGVKQRNDSPLQNESWVISLRRGMTRVIAQRRILGSEVISLRRIVTRVIPLRSDMGRYFSQVYVLSPLFHKVC